MNFYSEDGTRILRTLTGSPVTVPPRVNHPPREKTGTRRPLGPSLRKGMFLGSNSILTSWDIVTKGGDDGYRCENYIATFIIKTHAVTRLCLISDSPMTARHNPGGARECRSAGGTSPSLVPEFRIKCSLTFCWSKGRQISEKLLFERIMQIWKGDDNYSKYITRITPSVCFCSISAPIPSSQLPCGPISSSSPSPPA